MSNGKFVFKVSDDDEDVAYLQLPSHPGNDVASVADQKSLSDLIENYKGPDVYLDFDSRGFLIGIEILN